ncbi:phospholipase B-like protein [Scenedesmus sp. NREL 46B-D3]|nr:phospholipase B-like protein [Scenedesmus sp. NREL 46B-D3]
MQAAGFVEGYLTAPDIFNHWYNQRWWLSQKTNDTYKVMDWLMQHHTWLRQQLDEPANQSSPFWQAMQLVVRQLQGMLDGYNARVSAEGTALGIDFINLQEWLTLNTMGRCSALVKIAPDFSDIFVGHATWWTYTSMLKIYKHYTFELQGEQYKTRTTSMSSYPGSHLVVTETSNGILDPSVWRQVVPQAALSWQRVLVANWLSDSGAEWAHWIKQYNSGTYNNQYIIVDLKLFSPGAELQRGLLTIVEQMPGLVVAADKTQVLQRGYWPSYNIPFFTEVYNKSGYPGLAHRLQAKDESAYNAVVSGLSYQLAPRAKISRRDQGDVLSLHQLKAYMRSNSWASEPYSGNSPFGAICSRGDLDPAHPKASGCNDAKVTSYRLAMANAAEAVAGPTAGDGGDLGVFKWGGKWQGVAHRGQPEVFDFAYELQQP